MKRRKSQQTNSRFINLKAGKHQHKKQNNMYPPKSTDPIVMTPDENGLEERPEKECQRTIIAIDETK